MHFNPANESFFAGFAVNLFFVSYIQLIFLSFESVDEILRCGTPRIMTTVGEAVPWVVQAPGGTEIATTPI